MTDEELKNALCSAIDSLLKKDYKLIEFDVAERSIAHKLAEHLQLHFSDHCVDCEYNKNFDDSKEVHLIQDGLTEKLKTKYQDRLGELDADELLSISTYPDIIVHKRRSNEENLLVVELKKVGSKVSADLDDQKLRAFTVQSSANPYHYRLGAHVVVKTGIKEMEFPAIRWYVAGQPVERD